jgi:hypothetical protein
MNLLPKYNFSVNNLKCNNKSTDSESNNTLENLLSKEKISFTDGKFLVWESDHRKVERKMKFESILLYLYVPIGSIDIINNILENKTFSVFKNLFWLILISKYLTSSRSKLRQACSKIYLIPDMKRIEIHYTLSKETKIVEIKNIESEIQREKFFIAFINRFRRNEIKIVNFKVHEKEPFIFRLWLRDYEITDNKVLSLIRDGKKIHENEK